VWTNFVRTKNKAIAAASDQPAIRVGNGFSHIAGAQEPIRLQAVHLAASVWQQTVSRINLAGWYAETQLLLRL